MQSQVRQLAVVQLPWDSGPAWLETALTVAQSCPKRQTRSLEFSLDIVWANLLHVMIIELDSS